MAKDLTAKDVLYALEYLGDALVRTPIRDGKAKWEMRDSRLAVKDRIAGEVQAHPNVAAYPDMAKTVVVWRSAA